MEATDQVSAKIQFDATLSQAPKNEPWNMPVSLQLLRQGSINRVESNQLFIVRQCSYLGHLMIFTRSLYRRSRKRAFRNPIRSSASVSAARNNPN
jgi:hypothetical protein